jgi:hypothetical protein
MLVNALSPCITTDLLSNSGEEIAEPYVPELKRKRA